MVGKPDKDKETDTSKPKTGMNVKGSIFIELVKFIKKDKTGFFDNYLTDKDREIINQNLLPSSWYPYEPYKHCLKAMVEVAAKNDFEVVKEWGRASCQRLMTGMYSSVIKNCDPFSFLKKYHTAYRQYYDFGKTEVVQEGKNQALYKLSDFDAQFAPIYYSILGWMERGLELCGAKDVKSEFATKSWEGEPATSIRFTWT